MDGMLIAVVAIVVIAAIALVVYARWATRRKTERLMGTFGPEYDYALDMTGSRRDAESELVDREKRHDKLGIRPLSPDAGAAYLARWTQTQANFVDYPRSSVSEAHELVIEVMRERGYPIDNFEQRAADVSVEHPEFVENYRSAHAIATSSDPSTEDLRRAMVNYRALFADLLEIDAEQRDPKLVEHSSTPDTVDLRGEDRPLRYR